MKIVIKVSNVRILKFVPMVGFSGLPCKNAFNCILKAHATRYIYLQDIYSINSNMTIEIN